MYIIDFNQYLFEVKTSGYAKLRSLGFLRYELDVVVVSTNQ